LLSWRLRLPGYQFSSKVVPEDPSKRRTRDTPRRRAINTTDWAVHARRLIRGEGNIEGLVNEPFARVDPARY